MNIRTSNNIFNIKLNKLNIDIDFSERKLFTNNIKNIEEIYGLIFAQEKLEDHEFQKIETKILTITKIFKNIKEDLKETIIDDEGYFNILMNTIFLMLVELDYDIEELIKSYIYMDWKEFIAIAIEELLDDDDIHKDINANFSEDRIISLINKLKVHSMIIGLAEDYIDKNITFDYDKTSTHKYKVKFTNGHAKLINIGGIISKIMLPIVVCYLRTFNIKDLEFKKYKDVKSFIRDVFLQLFYMVELLYRRDKKDKVISRIISDQIEQGIYKNKTMFDYLDDISNEYSRYDIEKRINGHIYTNLLLSIKIDSKPLNYILVGIENKINHLAKSKVKDEDRIILLSDAVSTDISYDQYFKGSKRKKDENDW